MMSPVRTLSIKPDPAVYSGRDGERLVGVLGGPILESRPVLNAGGNEGGGMALGTILHLRSEVHHLAEAASVGEIEGKRPLRSTICPQNARRRENELRQVRRLGLNHVD